MRGGDNTAPNSPLKNEADTQPPNGAEPLNDAACNVFF